MFAKLLKFTRLEALEFGVWSLEFPTALWSISLKMKFVIGRCARAAEVRQEAAEAVFAEFPPQ
jgi:hypothetical protein